MMSLTLLRLGASLMVAAVALASQVDAADSDINWDENKVLGLQGGAVPVGEPVMVYTNVSNSKYAKDGFEKMEIYLDVQAEQNTSLFFPDVYCVIVPCVWTNVTTLNITIPKDAFPSGAEMKIWSEIYDSHQPDKDPTGFVSPSKSVRFNSTGGTGSFSEFEKRNGWSIFGSDAYIFSCDVITCARKCMVKYLDPNKAGFAQEYTKAMRDCTKACGPFVEDLDKRDKCITTNATEHKEAGSGGGTGDKSKDDGGDGSSAAARGMLATAGQAGAMLAAWSLAWLVM